MSEQMDYEEFRQQYEEAYTAFRQTYELRSPPPVREIAQGTSRWLYLSLAVTVIASVVVSGSRTIPEFGDVGFAAFLMLEVGMILYAFLRTRTDYDEKQHKSLKKRITQAFYLAFGIAVIANIHHVVKTDISMIAIGDVQVGAAIEFVIKVSLAFSAPTLAFIAGDILGMESAIKTIRQSKLDKQYNRELKKWNDGLNRSWGSQKAKWGAEITVSAASHPQLPSTERLSTQTDNRQTGYGYERNSSAVDTALEYLKANPDALSMSVREIGDAAGVGKDSAAKARRLFQERETSTNGHH